MPLRPFPRLLTASVLAVLPLVSAQAAAPAWKTFAPKGGGFSVALPGTPKAERKVSQAKDGSKTTEQDYEFETDSMLLKLSYQEHEAQFARLVNTSGLLDEVASAALKEMGEAGNKPQAKKMTLNGFEGRDVSTKTQGVNMRLRVFWAGRRLYAQVAAFPETPTAKADAAKFINSLKLLKPQPK